MNLLPDGGLSTESFGRLAVAGLVMAGLGGLLARAVTSGVGRLLDIIDEESGDGRPPGGRRHRGRQRGIATAAAILALALFFWEVVCGGLGPLPSGPIADAVVGGAWSATLVRCAAHLVLFAFLAAAAWSDLEHRVIPDAITVPGTLLGVAWVAAVPAVLPPVACQQARSFATPIVTPDSLGAIGPLACTAASTVLGPMPSVGGLAASVVAFLLWWLVCTAPGGVLVGRFDPRPWLLPAGLALVAIAWCLGGLDSAATLHFRGLEAALVGGLVSGGLVWMTRAGASLALGREAMGLGDVTLMAMVGSWCGWQLGVLAFFVAVFIGLAQGLVAWLRRGEHELPYGPSLCLASGMLVLAWPAAWRRVSPFFDEPLLLFSVMAMVVLLTGLTLAALARLRGGAAG